MRVPSLARVVVPQVTAGAQRPIVVQDGKHFSLVLHKMSSCLINHTSQNAFGTCAAANDLISTTGMCGVNNGKLTCAGGPFDGQCCSPSGWW